MIIQFPIVKRPEPRKVPRHPGDTAPVRGHPHPEFTIRAAAVAIANERGTDAAVRFLADTAEEIKSIFGETR